VSFGPSFFDRLTGTISLLTGQGPILGDPEPCLRLGVGAILASDINNYRDVGDATGGAGFGFEFWFRPSGFPGAYTDVARGPISGVAANHQWVFRYNTDGVMTFYVYGNDGVYYSASQPVSIGPWHHIFGQSDGATFVQLYVDGIMVSGAFSGGFIAGLNFGGAADMILGGPASSATGFDFAYAAFYGAPISDTRIVAHYVAGTQRGYPTQSVDTRINSVLNSVGSRVPRRLGAATRNVTDLYLVGGAPIDAVRDALSAEAVDSGFFAGSDGALVFLGAGHRSSSPYNASQATFGDGAGEMAYADVTIDYSDSFLYNYWNLTREGTQTSPGVEQISSDATSISRYFKRAQIITGIPVTADADAANIASAMLAKYKDPMQRITRISFTTDDPNVAEAVFRRDLMDCIRVLRTVPGGGSRIDQTLYIQKIEITGANDELPWTVSWGVSPL